MSWTIIMPARTFYPWQESRICDKYIRKLATQIDLHPALTPELKEIILYELVRELYGMAWSRYSWVREPPVDLEGYFDPIHTELGNHYSKLAVLVLHIFQPSENNNDAALLQGRKDLAEELTSAFIATEGSAEVVLTSKIN